MPCQHNSTCIELVDDFICICAGGWTDSTCSTNINECFSSPCENQGICQDEINGYNCVCQPGFTGTRCETSKYLTYVQPFLCYLSICATEVFNICATIPICTNICATMLWLWKMWTFSTMISIWFQLFLWVNAKVCQSFETSRHASGFLKALYNYWLIAALIVFS